MRSLTVRPYSDGTMLRELVDRMFEAPLYSLASSLLAPRLTWEGQFPLDVYEGPEHYIVVAAIPGVDPEKVEVTAANGTLTISGEASYPAPAESKPIWREVPQGQFRRQLTLPSGFEAEGITAEAAHGLLTITVPKAQAARARKVPVKLARA